MIVPSFAVSSDCWESCVAGGTALRSLNQSMPPRVAPPAAATAGMNSPAKRAPATTLATMNRLSRPSTRPAAAGVLRMGADYVAQALQTFAGAGGRGGPARPVTAGEGAEAGPKGMLTALSVSAESPMLRRV